MEGLSTGTTAFEIQLVEHIGTQTYFTRTHQRAVNRFGKCAYEAVGLLNDHLMAEGFRTRVHAVVGSNGAKVLTENVRAWKPYLQTLSL